ncbi:MAG: HD domain-containing phosphohydrolase [Phycisphaerales bacterium]|jgi:putative nucleotidyltransferase with HDIG domain
MMDLLEQALGALQAAFESRRLYTPQSPVAAQRARDALASLTTLGSAHPGTTAVLLPDRIVVGEEPLHNGGRMMQGGLQRLRDRGIAAIRINAAPTDADLAAILACMESDQNPVPRLSSIGLHGAGEAGVGVSGATPGRGFVPASMVARLQGVLDPLGTRAELETNHLASLTSELAALSVTRGDALIPLSELRTHDEYTYVHTINVAMLSGALAQAMGLSPDKVHDITCAAMLHDVGKVRTPSEILNKKQDFTKEDVAIMRRHPEDGARLLIAAGVKLDVAIAVAYEHHMHRGGGGYPNPPARWKMHVASQIVQVADVFDALRTNRPYREALSLEKARETMEREAGNIFDPALLQIFFAHVAARTRHAA